MLSINAGFTLLYVTNELVDRPTYINSMRYPIMGFYSSADSVFTSNQSIVLVDASYPPFGLATISFMRLSSYLILVGVYSSAISIVQDVNLRKSIRKTVEQYSDLLDHHWNLTDGARNIQKNNKNIERKIQ